MICTLRSIHAKFTVEVFPDAESGTEGLGYIHPHGWLRSLGRWLHLEDRDQSIHR